MGAPVSTKELTKMKRTLEESSSTFLRMIVIVLAVSVLAAIVSCGFQKKPSTVVEDLCRTVERGEIDRAAALMSQGFVSRQGIDTIKESLRQTALWLKNDGGIKEIKVLKEDTVGDVAEVTIQITRGGGDSSVVHYKLIREQGDWKVDGVASDSAGNEPLHSDTAVHDVVTWAHQSGADKLTSWFQKQAAPPNCKVGKIDRSTLPDEVKYHDVADGKQRDRLLTGLEPVIKLIGCSNKDGVVLYEGLNIYAGSLPDGHIAITPGSSYLVSSSPQENIFHDLARLRILLAREIHRSVKTDDLRHLQHDAL